MFDWTAFSTRVAGMVARPLQTLAEDGRAGPPWPIVARDHVLPLLVLTALVQFVLILFAFGPTVEMGLPQPGLDDALLVAVVRIVANLLGLSLMAGMVALYSGLFGGSRRYDDSYALLALSLTPVYLAEAVMPAPWIGLPIALAGFIYALVIFYRGLGLVLMVPAGNRVKHFALTLGTLFALSLFAGWLMFGSLLTATP